jgi:hypothetical protein
MNKYLINYKHFANQIVQSNFNEAEFKVSILTDIIRYIISIK